MLVMHFLYRYMYKVILLSLAQCYSAFTQIEHTYNDRPACVRMASKLVANVDKAVRTISYITIEYMHAEPLTLPINVPRINFILRA